LTALEGELHSHRPEAGDALLGRVVGLGVRLDLLVELCDLLLDRVGAVRPGAVRGASERVCVSDGRDQPARGTAWVEPVTGRLVRGEIMVDSDSDQVGYIHKMGFTAAIDVVFRNEPRLGFWVPSEMTERYRARDMSTSSGEATYSNYRTFGVETRIISP